MRRGGEQCGADQASKSAIWFLQARIELFKSKALALQKAIQTAAFAREMLLNFRLHRLRVRARKHCFIREIERVHRIEPLESQVVARTPASFDKKFVEQKLHHQERRPKVEAVFAKPDFRVTAANDVLLFEDLNAKAALRKQHRRGKPSRPRSHNYDVSFLIALLKAHSPTIESPRRQLAGAERSNWNHLIHMQTRQL